MCPLCGMLLFVRSESYEENGLVLCRRYDVFRHLCTLRCTHKTTPSGGVIVMSPVRRSTPKRPQLPERENIGVRRCHLNDEVLSQGPTHRGCDNTVGGSGFENMMGCDAVTRENKRAHRGGSIADTSPPIGERKAGTASTSPLGCCAYHHQTSR